MRLPASPGGRFAVWAVALLGGVALLLMLVDRLTPTPTGPASSSYATTPKGVGAYAELLEAEVLEAEDQRRAALDFFRERYRALAEL